MMDPEPSGILLYVYRPSGLGDCSNEGISSRHDRVTLILPNGGPVVPTEDAPAVTMERGPLGSIRVVELGKERLAMMGGCYVATSDGRFHAECKRLLGHRFYGAVALHDRYEED